MTDIKIVIDANFGDSGKGMMTDYFCHRAMQKANKCLVVCSNGGAQRGHTVETPEGIRHVFHHFGSGTLVGADTYLPDKFILNPMIFREEYLKLEKLGFTPRVYVNGKCIITTPYDMILNQYLEYVRDDKRHGSCGCGIWETIVRNDSKNTHVVFNLDTLLLNTEPAETLKIILEHIRDNYLYSRLIQAYYPFETKRKIDVYLKENQWYELIFSEDLMKNYISDFLFMLSKVEIVEDNILKNYEQIVFENGQGLLLDQDMKAFGVHTTPSSTGIKNPLEIIDKVYSKEEQETEINLEACYVSRTYLTRHGAGYLPDECLREDISSSMEIDLTNLPNPYQGELRYGFINTYYLDKRINDDFITCNHKFLNKIQTSATTHVNETSGEYAVSENDTCFACIIEDYVSDGRTRNDIMSNLEFRKKWGK